jgi:hypothetical protein
MAQKELPQEYAPTSPPVNFPDWHRWIDDELQRIRAALIADPVIIAVQGSGTIPIDTVVNTVTLGIGDTPAIDVPEGAWDPLTGIWTCALGGIYTITVNATIDAFGPGNKTYYAQLDVVEVAPSPGVRLTNSDGGADDVPLGVSIAAPIALATGTQLRFDLSTLHTQFTGSSSYNYSLSLIRSAAG